MIANYIEEFARQDEGPSVLCGSPQRLTETFGWKPAASDLRQIAESAWRWKRGNPHGYGVTQLSH